MATGYGIRVHRTGLRCTSFHRFQPAAIFYPNFYPKRQRGRIEMLYLLVTAAKLEWPTSACYQPSKLVMRVRFPSPALDYSR